MPAAAEIIAQAEESARIDAATFGVGYAELLVDERGRVEGWRRIEPRHVVFVRRALDEAQLPATARRKKKRGRR